MAGLKLAVFLLAMTIATKGQLSQSEREKIKIGTQKAKRLPHNVCGQSSEKALDRKIINGEPAELGAYPWMAAIGYTLNDRGPYWNCGGTLITDQYVLTAAHCVDPARISSRNPFKVSVVRLGDLNLDDSVTDKAEPEDVPVAKVLWHEKYNSPTQINDVGLLKLARKIQFSEYIRPICLPPPAFRTKPFTGTFAMVTGWGTSSFDPAAKRRTELLEAEVEIVDTDECSRNVTQKLKNAVLDQRVICAASPGKDSCQGDSGGPLIVFRRHNNKPRMFLLGVVSYGYKCAEEGYPGVYMRVTEYMPWIIDNLEI